MASCGQVLVVFLSFFLTECRAIIAFYFSFKSFVALVPEWFFEHVSLSLEEEMVLRGFESNHSAIRLGDFLQCLSKDFIKMTKTLGPVFEGECLGSGDEGQLDQLSINIPVPRHLLFSITNYVGLAIVLAFTVILLIELAIFRPQHFGSGAYIAFTIHLRSLLAYKIAAYLLAAFNLWVLLGFAYIGYRCYAADTGGMSMALQFLANFAGTLGGVLYSGIAFALPEEQPHELFLGPEFQEMVFKRKAKEVATDNIVFLKHLDHAALVAAALSDSTALLAYTGTGTGDGGDGYTTMIRALSLLAKARSPPANAAGYLPVPTGGGTPDCSR